MSTVEERVKNHALWLQGKGGARASFVDEDLSLLDFFGMDLRKAYFGRANLRGVDFGEAKLGDADFTEADLSNANLTHANAYGAVFRNADMEMVKGRGVNLIRASLECANLTGANLSNANLGSAYARGAKFHRASMRSVILTSADLSGAAGLLDPAAWLSANFEKDDRGLIVYKAFGNTTYNRPERWKVYAGEELHETVNPDRCCDCGCGVNFGTRQWCEDKYPLSVLWRCRIDWIDLAGVVVPYNTDGKARCSKMTLIQEVY